MFKERMEESGRERMWLERSEREGEVDRGTEGKKKSDTM